ncbi:MAG: DUF3999 domain-containing protein [Candidatus Anammoximicrobium sp.]|nr:DUF3999 domain-containing protein [Candidatus Anammoximicrobium sp.]
MMTRISSTLSQRNLGLLCAVLTGVLAAGVLAAGAVGSEPPGTSAGQPRGERAAEAVSAWQFLAEVPVAGAGKSPLIDFVLPPSVFDAARVDLADLRLYDAQLREVPYALRIRSDVDTTEAVEGKEFNRVPDPAGGVQLSLDLNDKQIDHNEVEVNTPGDNYRRRVVLEGSDDGNQWNELTKRDIVRFPSGEKAFVDKTLSYTPSRYRYLRITVSPDPQNDTRPIEIGDVVVRRRVKVPGELDVREVPYGQREATRADGGPGSRWVLDLQGRDVPVDRLLVTVADEEFVRNWYVEAGGPADAHERFQRVASGVWQRRAGERVEDMAAEFGHEVRAARLRLVVTDNRNPPLRLTTVKAAAPARVVIAKRPESPSGPWRLYFGHPKAEAPNYDFARNLPQKLAPPPDRLPLGPRQPNPIYQPAPLPLTERLPWLIYVLLGAAVAVLAVFVFNLARVAIRIADLRESAA